jgi:urease accessory protein
MPGPRPGMTKGSMSRDKPMLSERTSQTFARNRAVGKVALTVHARDGISRRARVHEHGSLRVRCPGAPAAELEAVLINTAGGIAGGDRFAVDINAGTGARLIVTTAAAEKVYRALGEAAAVDVRLTVGDGAALAWLPQETILFDRAKLRRTVEINLAADAQLLLAEAIVFGRAGMGEAVEDCELSDRWHLRRGGRLVHVEALRLDGAAAAKLRRPAVANGGIAVATVLLAPGDETAATAVRALEEQFRGEVGVSAWKGLAIARLCAADGAALRHDLLLVLAALRTSPLPRLWLN